MIPKSVPPFVTALLHLCIASCTDVLLHDAHCLVVCWFLYVSNYVWLCMDTICNTLHCLYKAAFELFCPIVGLPVNPAVQETDGLIRTGSRSSVRFNQMGIRCMCVVFPPSHQNISKQHMKTKCICIWITLHVHLQSDQVFHFNTHSASMCLVT